MKNARLAAKREKLKIKFDVGQSLVEILLVIGLMGIFLPALLTGFLASRQGKAQQGQRVQAVALLREGEEIVRSVREKDWASFAVNGTYHPVASGSAWTLAPNSETINGFTRKVVISDVYRDANGVATTSGTIDPSTKQAVTTVSWSTPIVSSVQATQYLTRYLGNTFFLQTTQGDFNTGSTSGTTVTNTAGGEVVLGAGGSGDWCTPQPIVSAADLPKSGVANAITAIEGSVFAGTGDNASGVSFANVTIPNTASPSGTITGTFDGYKTNGVFGEANYAYLATDTNSREIMIIDLSSLPYAQAGYFDAPGNGTGNSVFVSGNIGYMTDGNKLYTFDLSSKSGSRSQLGSITLPATGNKVVVVGNYAYVVLDSTSSQMQIVQVSSDGKTLTLAGTASVAGQNGVDVFINSTATRAYLATQSSDSQKEMFIVDIATKTGSRPTVGSYDTNGMSPKGITAVTSNKAIIVGTGGEEYQVFSIVDETNPVRCGGMDLANGANGVASVLEADGDAFSYIITGDASSELKIIRGGAGGGNYQASGFFESGTFDALNSVLFNRFMPTAAKPSLTDVTYQVAGADANPASGNCTGATFSFVGPDGTNSTYFATSSAIPTSITGTYRNPARCFRYKTFLSTTDQTQSPVLYDMTVNYSP